MGNVSKESVLNLGEKIHPHPTGTPSKGGQVSLNLLEVFCLKLFQPFTRRLSPFGGGRRGWTHSNLWKIPPPSAVADIPLRRGTVSTQIHLLFLFLLFLLPNFGFTQTEKINLDVSNEKIEDVLLNLAADSDYEIIFTPSYFSDKTISIQAVNESIKKVLTRLLKNTKVDFLIVDRTIVLSKQKRVYGYLSDAKTGERLINGSVFHVKTQSGGYTNEHGFFSFELPFEIKKISASYIGYKTKEIEIEEKSSISLNIELEPEAYLSEVVVLSSQSAEQYHARFQDDAEELLTNKVNSFVATGGVPDIFQYLYKKPGVSSGPDGLGGLHVRGGNTDQNLILFDGVKVYSPSHTFGLYSIFNPTLLQHAKFSKSNFNPRNGGRISSVLDLRLKEGSLKKWGGSAAISNITSEAMIEGPLVKDKTGLLLSFRRSHVDNFIKNYTANQKEFFFEDEFEYWFEDGLTNQYFYDINAKLHHKINNDHKIFLSAYVGNDKFSDSVNRYYDNEDFEFSDDSLSYNLVWGNEIFALRWNHIWNQQLFSNATFSYSNFQSKATNFAVYDYAFLEEDGFYYGDAGREYSAFTGRINDLGVDYDFDLFLGKKHHLTFGTGFHHIKYKPGSAKFTDEFIDFETVNIGGDFFYAEVLEDSIENPFESNELHFYFNEDFSFSQKWRLNFGARAALFQSKDLLNKFNDNFFLFQPRIAIEYRPTNIISLLFSAEKIEQPLHQLTNSEVGFPNDLWVPASERVQPQIADQFNLTATYQPSEKLKIKASAYNKSIDNLIQYREGTTLPTLTSNASFAWQEDVISGVGNSRGIELEAETQSKKFRGDIAYAYTKSTRRFNNLNDGEVYPFRFDQRNAIAINAYVKITPKIWAYANWQFNSGIPQTLFLDTLGFYNPITVDGEDLDSIVSRTNAHLIPNFHRLDVGILATFKKKNFTHELNIGVQNVYRRRNVWYEVQLPDYFLEEDENPIESRTGLPLLPVVRYRVEF